MNPPGAKRRAMQSQGEKHELQNDPGMPGAGRGRVGAGGRSGEDRLHRHAVHAGRLHRRGRARCLQPGHPAGRRQAGRRAGRAGDRGRRAQARQRQAGRRPAAAIGRQALHRRELLERAGGGGAGRGEVGRVLRQPEPRTVELRWREVRSQLLRRVLPERRLPHRRRRGGQRTGLQARGAARAELPGRARRHRRLQAHLQGRGRGRDLHQARPVGLRSSWRGCVRWRPTRSTSSIPAAPASTSSSSTRRPG